MKKSIFKVTAWSIIIAIAVIVSIEKGFNINGSKKGLTINQTLTDAQINEENARDNEGNEPQNNGIDYNATAYKDAYQEQPLDFASNNASSNTTSSTVMAGDLAYENTFNKNEVSNNNEPIINEDAVAKGGPNNNNNSFQSQEVSTLNASIATSAPTSSTVSSSPTSARLSSPTIVTTPPNPSGSTSGGSSAGDPFVPIDDYYGLIFLIAVSTIVGVYSLKKSRIV